MLLTPTFIIEPFKFLFCVLNSFQITAPETCTFFICLYNLYYSNIFSNKSSILHPSVFESAKSVAVAALFISLAFSSYCCKVLKFTPDFSASSLWEYPIFLRSSCNLVVVVFLSIIEFTTSTNLSSEASWSVGYNFMISFADTVWKISLNVLQVCHW